MTGYTASALDIATVCSTLITLGGCACAFYGPVYTRELDNFDVSLNLYQVCYSYGTVDDCNRVDIWKDGLWDHSKYYSLARLILPVGAFFGIISCIIAFMACCSL
jgi:hypothetical protein